jgi:hypothetical protein
VFVVNAEELERLRVAAELGPNELAKEASDQVWTEAGAVGFNAFCSTHGWLGDRFCPLDTALGWASDHHATCDAVSIQVLALFGVLVVDVAL